jgi:hypothetical protein
MGMIGAKSPDSNNAVLCLEVWVKPGGHLNFLKGGMFTVLGDQVVQIFNDFPYNHREYPFSKLEHIESGKFYGTSVIEDLLPVQKEYNRTRSQIIENKNRMAKLQLMAPKGSIEVSKVSSEPGQVILYTPGYNPPQTYRYRIYLPMCCRKYNNCNKIWMILVGSTRLVGDRTRLRLRQQRLLVISKNRTILNSREQLRVLNLLSRKSAAHIKLRGSVLD